MCIYVCLFHFGQLILQRTESRGGKRELDESRDPNVFFRQSLTAVTKIIWRVLKPSKDAASRFVLDKHGSGRLTSPMYLRRIRNEISEGWRDGERSGKLTFSGSSGNWWSNLRAAFVQQLWEWHISMSRISSESFTPFSHHHPPLPRGLHRLPLLTSWPLMPFSIDHYPPLPLPLLASAQSETPASPRSLLCRCCSGKVRGLRSAAFDCLLWFDLCGSCGRPALLAHLNCQ